VRIDVVEEAQAQFADRDEWWRANRDAKELFVDEYERALAHLIGGWLSAASQYPEVTL
jgi:hypothetical protein